MVETQVRPLKLRGATVLSIRVLGFFYVLLGVSLFAALSWDLAKHGLNVTSDSGGTLAAWVAVAGLMAIPTLVMVGLGVGLIRLDRAAWVGQVTAGIVVPCVSGLFLLLGLGVDAWAWILSGLAFAYAVSLPLLLHRAARWCFGIGPDAVLAEIDVREEVSVAQLAEKFRVAPAVIEALLDKAIALGVFAGAWERETGRVYSVDTVLSREALRRCPRCGAAVDALGNVARCPYCATEFANLTGLDYPMPTPIGVAVLAALDRVLGYSGAFMALMWSAIFVGWRMRPTDGVLEALVWLIFGGGPLLLAWAALQVGWRLEAGQRSGWIGQMVLQPLAIPYLLRLRVRTLYSSAIQPLQARLAADGQLSIHDLARYMGVERHHADDVAIYLSASGALDTVLDWQQRRLLRRDQLGIDGREGCKNCGAPLRLGGICAFCGTRAVDTTSQPDSPPAPRKSASSRGGWRFARFTLGVSTVGVVVLALIFLRPDPSPSAQLPELTARVQRVDQRLVPAGGYDPARQEVAWVSGGVTFLGFAPGGQLLSGEQNGLFVWDYAARRRTLRTPAEVTFAGVRWVGHVPGTDKFLFLPYHTALYRGDGGTWRITERTDFNRLPRTLQAAEETPLQPAVATLAVQPDGRVLVAFLGRRAYLVDLSTGDQVFDMKLPASFEARELALDREARRIAVLARSAEPREELVLVWDIATKQIVFTWRDTPKGFQWAMMAGGRQGRLALSPDGTRLVTLDASDLRYWDVNERRLLRRITGVSGRGPIAFAAGGGAFAIARTTPPEAVAKRIAVFRVDAEGARHMGTFGSHDAGIQALTFDPSGEHVISGDAAGEVRFWDLSTMKGPPLP